MGSLILLKAFFFVIFFNNVISVDGSDTKATCSPESTQVVKFFDIEMLVVSQATLCHSSDRKEASKTLTKLLYDAFRTIPDLISATASICALPMGSNSRTLLQNNNKTEEKDEILLPTLPASVDNLQIQRKLRHLFVYHGGMRCSFCLRDNLDHRRELHHGKGECRQSRNFIFESPKAKHWKWKNGKSFKFRDEINLGPYTNGDNFSQTFVVPPQTSILQIKFKLLHRRIGGRWGPKDMIYVSINGKTIALRTTRKFFEQNDWLSAEMRWEGKKRAIYKTRAAINVDLERGPFDLSRTNKVKLSFHIKTTSPKKRVAFHRFTIRALRTCTLGRTKVLEMEDLSFEERMELLLSTTLTTEFRKGKVPPCFVGKKTFIHVNLYERENEQKQQCS